MIMPMFLKVLIFLFGQKKERKKCTQRKMYGVICPNATKTSLVEDRL